MTWLPSVAAEMPKGLKLAVFDAIGPLANTPSLSA